MAGYERVQKISDFPDPTKFQNYLERYDPESLEDYIRKFARVYRIQDAERAAASGVQVPIEPQEAADSADKRVVEPVPIGPLTQEMSSRIIEKESDSLETELKELDDYLNKDKITKIQTESSCTTESNMEITNVDRD